MMYGVPRWVLAKLQNAAVRLVALSSSRQYITPVLRQLHWLPVEYRVKCKIITLTFKALHGKAPSYILWGRKCVHAQVLELWSVVKFHAQI